jgi:uridine kinase
MHLSSFLTLLVAMTSMASGLVGQAIEALIQESVAPHLIDHESESCSAAAPVVVGLAGGSGSGKTTLTKAIIEAIGMDNLTIIPHDNYYKDWSHLPPEERENINFDHPDCLDTDLLIEDLKKLKNGEKVRIPTYDFATHTRKPGFMEIQARRIIIVEGILIFSYRELCDLMDIKVFVETPDDLRLIRRISRDIVERGRNYDSVVQQYLKTVRPMHIKFVEPSKNNADIIVPAETMNPVALDLVVCRLQHHLNITKE